MITAAELFDYLNIARPAWLTATAYQKGDYVTNSGTVYECLIAHTSGTFATDLAALKWTASHFVQASVDYAIGRVNKFCNRDFRSASYTDYYSPDSSGNTYWLKNPPGSALTSIKKFDDDTGAYVTIFESPDVIGDSARLESGQIILYNGYSFSPAYRYEIVYTGGYSTVPENIKGACKEIAALHYKVRSGRLGLTSKNIGGASDKGEGYDNGTEARILESVSMYKLYNV